MSSLAKVTPQVRKMYEGIEVATRHLTQINEEKGSLITHISSSTDNASREHLLRALHACVWKEKKYVSIIAIRLDHFTKGMHAEVTALERRSSGVGEALRASLIEYFTLAIGTSEKLKDIVLRIEERIDKELHDIVDSSGNRRFLVFRTNQFNPDAYRHLLHTCREECELAIHAHDLQGSLRQLERMRLRLSDSLDNGDLRHIAITSIIGAGATASIAFVIQAPTLLAAALTCLFLLGVSGSSMISNNEQKMLSGVE